MDDKFVVLMFVLSAIPFWLWLIAHDLVLMMRAFANRANAEARLASVIAGRNEPDKLDLYQEAQ